MITQANRLYTVLSHPKNWAIRKQASTLRSLRVSYSSSTSRRDSRPPMLNIDRRGLPQGANSTLLRPNGLCWASLCEAMQTSRPWFIKTARKIRCLEVSQTITTCSWRRARACIPKTMRNSSSSRKTMKWKKFPKVWSSHTMIFTQALLNHPKKILHPCRSLNARII